MGGKGDSPEERRSGTVYMEEMEVKVQGEPVGRRHAGRWDARHFRECGEQEVTGTLWQGL